MILLIDNYDSFVYNVAHALGALGETVKVVRNDAVTPDQALAMAPDSLVISPGPGTPDDAGVSRAIIETFLGRVPILGICLGHQCIASVLGGTVQRARHLVHGKLSRVYHDGAGLFAGLPSPMKATRYHSLAVAEEDLPACLEVSAQTTDGEIMGVRHRDHPVEGVQFHPESFLTERGRRLFQNFLALQGRKGGGKHGNRTSDLGQAGRALSVKEAS